MPTLEGFILTFLISIFELVFNNVKTIKNADELISPGIFILILLISFGLKTEIKSYFEFFFYFNWYF